MICVNNFDHFESVFNERKNERDLFAFLLFDDRETHESIKRFATDQFTWLNSLAIEARIFFFAFVPFDHDQGSSNPSPEVASLFGIRRKQLPGVVLFTMLDTRDGAKDHVYYRLKSELFKEETKVVEDVFVDLFTEIKNANKQGLEADSLLEEVRRSIQSIQKSDRMRPIKQYFIELVYTAADIPKDFLSSIGGAFASSTARSITG